MNLEEVSCPMCGPSPSDRLFDCPTLRLESAELRFTLRRCSGCGLAFTSPRPSPADMDLLYSSQYFPAKLTSGAGTISRSTTRERISFVRKYVPRGSVLDIGTGLGGFLMALPVDDFEVHGLEPYHGLFTSVPERIRSRIKFESFDSADFTEASFDLITLWNVLEHLPQPLACLQKTFRLIKPGGHLILEVPNLASIEARCLAHQWYHLDVPYHFWHFTPRTLSAMAMKAGFEISHVQSSTLTSPILLINYLFLGANSIERRAKEWMPFLKRWKWLDQGCHFLSVPICVLERFCLFFSTPTMRLVARKKG
jgi:ubiquinone/menaquinone biosynthesis C-methylase UbiE